MATPSPSPEAEKGLADGHEESEEPIGVKHVLNRRRNEKKRREEGREEKDAKHSIDIIHSSGLSINPGEEASEVCYWNETSNQFYDVVGKS